MATKIAAIGLKLRSTKLNRRVVLASKPSLLGDLMRLLYTDSSNYNQCSQHNKTTANALLRTFAKLKKKANKRKFKTVAEIYRRARAKAKTMCRTFDLNAHFWAEFKTTTTQNEQKNFKAWKNQTESAKTLLEEKPFQPTEKPKTQGV